MWGASVSRPSRWMLAAGLALLAPAAARACDAAIVSAPATLRLEYDAFAAARTVGRVLFEIEARGSEACRADLVLLGADRAPLAEADIGDSGVRVALSAGDGDAPLAPTATPGVWRVAVEPGRRVRLSLGVVVVRDAVAAAGEHGTELLLELVGAGEGFARAAAPVRLVLASAPRAQMNIVGAAGTFGEGFRVTSIDFGEMRTGATRRVFLQLRANTAARLRIDSANRGRLLRADAAADETGIAYGALLLGSPVDLTRRWEQPVDAPRSLAGASVSLDFTLGPVEGHPAGSYSDLLEVELSAL